MKIIKVDLELKSGINYFRLHLGIYLFLNLMSNVICFKILDDLFLTFFKRKLKQLEKNKVFNFLLNSKNNFLKQSKYNSNITLTLLILNI